MKILLFITAMLFSFNAVSSDLEVNAYGVFSDLYEDKFAVSISGQSKGNVGLQGEGILISKGVLAKFGAFKKIGQIQVNLGLMAGREDQQVVFSDGDLSKSSPNSNSLNAYLGLEYSYFTIMYVISKKDYKGDDFHSIGQGEDKTYYLEESINDRIESSAIWIGLKFPL